jgi:hypothetical protein
MSELFQRVAARWRRANLQNVQSWLSSFEPGEERDILFMLDNGSKRGTIVFDGLNYEAYAGPGRSVGVLGLEEAIDMLTSGDVQPWD